MKHKHFETKCDFLTKTYFLTKEDKKKSPAVLSSELWGNWELLNVKWTWAEQELHGETFDH